MPPVRVTVPSSAVAAERRSFTLNLPSTSHFTLLKSLPSGSYFFSRLLMKQSVAVVPHRFYSRYQRRLVFSSFDS
ncbi:hypothetical protein PIB30_066179, partial [Stylosanthes scabra]|nr:hypothetical protein [Stylosanthes scabra]